MSVLNIDPAIIAALGALPGTLQGNDSLTSLQAQEDQNQQALAQQAKQAADQASQAGQQYGNAAAAPPPDVGGAAFIPTLVGNIASTLTENQAPAQRAAQRIRDQQGDLMEARRGNLEALKALYERKALAAEQLGHDAEAEKARLSHERVTAALQKVTQEQAHKYAMELEGEKAKGRLAQTQARAAAGTQDDSFYKGLERTTSGGIKWLDMSDLGVKGAPGAIKYATDNGMLALSKEGKAKVADVETARRNIKLMQSSMDFLPGSPAQRAVQGPINKLKSMAQTAPQIAAFNTYRTAAIQQLKALAGGVGSGLRINQAEIEQALKNDIPRITDTYDVANQKLQNIQDLLDSTLTPFLSRDLTKPQGGTGPRASMSASNKTTEKATVFVRDKSGKLVEKK